MFQDGWALPTDEELGALRWPLLDVARLLRMSGLVLELSGITADEARSIAEHLGHADGAEPEGLQDCDDTARTINGVRPELGPDGWIVPVMPPQQYRIQAHHVAAVAALLAGRRLLDLQPGMSRIALALSDIPGVRSEGSRMADLSLTALAGRCCRLAADAVFMLGRDEMRAAVIATKAAEHRSRSAMGAPKPRIKDGDLLDYLAQWCARYGKKRGSIKAAAHHFDMTEAGIRKALKRIRTG